LILGITAAITTVAVQKSTVKWEMPFMHIITIVLAVLGFTGGEIVLWEGIVLWALFLVYLGYLFKMAKNGTEEEEEEELQPLWKQLCMLAVGIVMIVFGSDMTVDNATILAEAFGMDDRLIGLTIVAFGTSLPELVTSVTAARKGKADIAIGNIVGSNVFNILFVVGTTALITPVTFKAGFVVDSVVALAAGLILWFGVMKEQKLKRPVGILMLAAYAAYFVYLLMG
jgi:cation:H+ antiporter